MPPVCEVAFKEWAVICRALETGEQILILRKGGIHEGRDGFRVAHRQFWLFPTYLHQADQSKLAPAAWSSLSSVLQAPPAEDHIPLRLLAEVTDVIEITDESQLARLAPWHWWSDQAIVERFHYRQPGLFLLIVRIYKSAEFFELPNSPHFAGCRTWVELPQPIPTTGLTPTVSDERFQALRDQILASVGSFRV